jgi:hypothetical protein
MVQEYAEFMPGEKAFKNQLFWLFPPTEVTKIYTNPTRLGGVTKMGGLITPCGK